MSFNDAVFDVSDLAQALVSCFDGLGRAEAFNAGLEAAQPRQTKPGPANLRVGGVVPTDFEAADKTVDCAGQLVVVSRKP